MQGRDHTRAFWVWSLTGALVALVLLVAQIPAVGGVRGLLQVGEQSPLRPLIEEELGDVPLVHYVGHDGQIYYAIGLDLIGDDVGQLFIDPAYRYRRILFPAVSSLFGLLDGMALLIGMMTTVVLAFAAASGAVAASARLLGRSEWLALSVILNPGIWLSVRLLTPEVLGTAFMALALMTYLLRRRGGYHFGFSMSVLSKEVFLLTPLGLAVSRDRRRWLVGIVPAAALLLWSAWGQFTMSGLEGEANNLTIPFEGIARAAEWWAIGGLENWLYLVFALGLTGMALVLGLTRAGWLRWSLLGWAVLAICSSWFVWRLGNNPARVFAPILVLIALDGAALPSSPTTAHQVEEARAHSRVSREQTGSND